MKPIRAAVGLLRRTWFKACAILVLGQLARAQVALDRPVRRHLRRLPARHLDEDVLAHSFGRDIFLSGVPEYELCRRHRARCRCAYRGFRASGGASGGRWPGSRRRGPPGDLRDLLHQPCPEPREQHCAESPCPGRPRRHLHALSCAARRELGDSTTHDYAADSEEVPGRSLRSFLTDRNIERVDFAKFNCEGGEFEILLGADPATLRRIGTMLVLYHCDLAKAFSEEQLLQHLHDCGFATEVRNRAAERAGSSPGSGPRRAGCRRSQLPGPRPGVLSLTRRRARLSDAGRP
ncbi:MAG: FkbM family methyltransferase [Geminicoccaceae bacterium]